MTSHGYHNPVLWTPARYVHSDQRCAFCGAHIPRSKPGSRVGDRGSKAFYNAALQRFECLDCRAEATRADLTAQQRQAPRTESCEACGYARLDSDSHEDAPLFALYHCSGCELAPGHGIHRTCPRCSHIEHRVYELQSIVPGTTAPRSEAA